MPDRLARLRATLPRRQRNTAGEHPRQVTVGHWRVDLSSHQVTRADGAVESSGSVKTLRLTPTEWAILELLLQCPGQLVGSAQLLTRVWGPASRSTRTTCGSIWPTCAASSKTTRRGPATCSPSPAWATAIIPEACLIREAFRRWVQSGL